ncbi:MAG: hypothetical protein H6711_04060 [Myxococcales bacterium]|nr:hypothetical protein [Myxococcales bacterium]
MDDCDEGLYCWYLDESNAGYCIAFCTGTDFYDAECPYPSVCVIDGSGVGPRCIPTCEPLLQDCPQGATCLPSHDAWICLEDNSGPYSGADGDPCEFVDACDPGILCAEANRVPGCWASGCCATICDLNSPISCPLKGEGAECVPFYAMGEAPPGKENIGFCGLP